MKKNKIYQAYAVIQEDKDGQMIFTFNDPLKAKLFYSSITEKNNGQTKRSNNRQKNK